MNVARMAKNCVLAAALLSIACYAAAEHELTWTILALAHPLVVLGWWLTERLGKRPLRRWLANGAVAGAVAWAAYVVYATKLEVSTFCQFLILVMVIRIWDAKQAKDMAQIVVLSVFLVIGAILTDTRLHLALLVLVTVPAIASAAAMLHVLASVERAERVDAPGEGVAVAAGLSKHLTLLLSVGLLIGLVVSLVVFVIMPRGIGLRALGRFGEVAGARTGFTDTVDLRRSGPIVESEVAVMEVSIEDDSGFPLGAPDRVLYLRGVALDHYERGAWTRSLAIAPSQFNLRPGEWEGLSRRSGRHAIVQKIRLREAAAESPMWAMLLPVSVRVESAARVRYSGIDGVLSRDDANGRSGRFEYAVRSIEPPLPRESALERWGEPATFPSDRVKELATSVLIAAGVEPDPEHRPPAFDVSAAGAIELFLRTGFAYTLDARAPPQGMDPIEAFLFERKSGHCELFAAAMAAMCRSVGVDARVVAGYLGTEYDPSSGVYTVRERNAHAWVEVRTDRWNWRTFDPTPPEDLARAHQPRATLAAKFNRWLDSLNSAWAVSVVSFDESSQRKLLGMNVNPSLEIQDKFMVWASRGLGGTQGEPGRAARWMMLGGVLALLAGAGVLLRMFGRLLWRRRGVGGPRPVVPREARFYWDAIKLLRRAGLPKPVWSTPMEHAPALESRHPEAPGVLRELAAIYYESRFAGRALSPEEAARGRELVVALRRLLAR